MRVPTVNPRHKRAQAEARKADEAFFRSHPGRCHHRRPSLPFEFAEWQTADGHLGEPITIVVRPNVRTLAHVTFTIDADIGAIPDEEAFLTRLWQHIRFRLATGNGGPVTLIGEHEHSELLRTTGHPLSQERVF